MNTAQYTQRLRALEERSLRGEDITQDAQTLFASIPDSEEIPPQAQKKAIELASLGFSSNISHVPEESFRALLHEYNGAIVSPDNIEAIQHRLEQLVESVTDIEDEIQDQTQEQQQLEQKNALLKRVIGVLNKFI